MKDFLSNKVLQIILRLVIGGIFLYASLDKLFNPEEFAKIIKGYDILPLSFINIFAIVLPYVEFVAGIFLVFGVYKKGSSAVISLIFTYIYNSSYARLCSWAGYKLRMFFS